MSCVPYGSVSLATLAFDARSQCPPPGRYAAMIIRSVDGRAARVVLTAEQAAAIGRWFQAPKSPSAKLKRRAGPTPGAPLQVSAVATDWDGLTEREPASRASAAPRSSGGGAILPTLAVGDEASARPAASGDKLVTGRFIAGFKARCADLTAEELERELATFGGDGSDDPPPGVTVDGRS